MREIMFDDFYLVSEIADKMDIKLPLQTKTVNGKTIKKTQEEYGNELITSLLKKAYKAKKELNQLIGILLDKDASKLGAKEGVDALTHLFKDGGFLSFFK